MVEPIARRWQRPLLVLVSALVAAGCGGLSPPEREGPPAELLLAGIPVFEAPAATEMDEERRGESVASIEWSPSGRYVLVQVDSRWTVGEESVLVIDLAAGTVSARFPGVLYAAWADADALWLVSEAAVEVAVPPFTAPPESRTASFPAFAEGLSSVRYADWALNGRARRFAVVERPTELDPWSVRVETEGAEPFVVEVYPRYPDRTTGGPYLRFTPSGRLLTVVFTGWIGYEASRPDELWLVDPEARTARALRSGRWHWWQIAEADTQSLAPSWTAAEDVLVVADVFFGVDTISLPRARRRRVAGARSNIAQAWFSRSGRWMAVERGWIHREEGSVSSSGVGLLRRDGGEIIRFRDPAAPATGAGAYYSHRGYATRVAWHPAQDRLLILRRNPQIGAFDLLSWEAPD